MSKRKRRSAQFKFQVALEAAKDTKTLSELSSEYEVHSTQISEWKNQLLKNGVSIFSAAPPATTGCGVWSEPPVNRPGTRYASPTTIRCGARRRTTPGLEPSPPPTPHREESRQVKVLAEKKETLLTRA